MAHQIETHGNRAAAFFARTDPWHRLRTTVAGEAFTAQDAMTLGHLGGWNVRKAPVSATEIGEDGVTTMEVPARTPQCARTPSPDRPNLSPSSARATTHCRTRSTPSS